MADPKKPGPKQPTGRKMTEKEREAAFRAREKALRSRGVGAESNLYPTTKKPKPTQGGPRR